MIKVCVLCTTYNHERFIADALKGFLLQKTNFDVEYVIHDDASTDQTPEIISRFEEEYPGFFTVIYEKENLHSQNIKFSNLLIQKAQAKYFALCEGDDYWTDPYKLQKQVNYMDTHPECTLTIHNGQTLNIETHTFKLINPYNRSRVLTTEEVLLEEGNLPPTASMVFRLDILKEMPEFYRSAPVGDRPKRIYAAIKGSVYYFEDSMCVYRINNPESFSGKVEKDKTYREKILNEMNTFFDKFNEDTNFQYDNEVQLMKSREYYTYYKRGNNMKEAMKTRYYKENIKFSIKIKDFMSVYLPSLYKSLRNLKSYLKRAKI